MAASKPAQEKGNHRSFRSHLASKATQWLLQNLLRRRVTIAHFGRISRAKLFNGCFKTCSGERSPSLILVASREQNYSMAASKPAQEKGNHRSFRSHLASKAIQWLLQNVLRRTVTIAHFGRISRAKLFNGCFKTCSGERSPSLILVGLASRVREQLYSWKVKIA